MLKISERRRLEKHTEITELVDAIGGPGFAERFLRVSPDTVKRWLDGTTAPPWSAIVALRAAIGRVPGMDAWQGWHFSERDGLLYAPGYNKGFGPGELLAWHFKEPLLEHLRRRVTELEKQLEAREAVIDELAPAANDRRVNQT